MSFIRTSIKHFFPFLLAFTFFLQLIHVFSFFNDTVNCKKTSTVLLHSTYDEEINLSLLPAHESNHATMEMEFDEDDYKHNNDQEFYNSFIQNMQLMRKFTTAF